MVRRRAYRLRWRSVCGSTGSALRMLPKERFQFKMEPSHLTVARPYASPIRSMAGAVPSVFKLQFDYMRVRFRGSPRMRPKVEVICLVGSVEGPLVCAGQRRRCMPVLRKMASVAGLQQRKMNRDRSRVMDRVRALKIGRLSPSRDLRERAWGSCVPSAASAQSTVVAWRPRLRASMRACPELVDRPRQPERIATALRILPPAVADSAPSCHGVRLFARLPLVARSQLLFTVLGRYVSEGGLLTALPGLRHRQTESRALA